MTRPVVLIAEELSPATIDALGPDFEVRHCNGADREQLLPALADADAVLIRSATKMNAEAIAAAKQANQSLKGGAWKRSSYGGVELLEKKVGIVGFGRIGQLVAERLKGFGMEILAYDPYVSAQRAGQLGAQLVTLDELLAEADFISIHLPKTPETIGLIGAEALTKVKPSVRIINAARGGVLDEAALATAIAEGRVAGAGLDVFDAEPCTDSPLFAFESGVVTPHLVEKLGRVFTAVAGAVPVSLVIDVRGEITSHDVSVWELAAQKGIFTDITEDPVTYVNAPLHAKERGLEVQLVTSPVAEDFRNVTTLRGTLADGTVRSVSGTLTGPKMVQKITKGIEVGFLQDVEIWKNKTRIENPLLVEGHGRAHCGQRHFGGDLCRDRVRNLHRDAPSGQSLLIGA